MILCLGTTPALQRTLIFDHFVTNDVNRAVEVRETASGKSINVARVLKTLRQEPLATGFLGGETGRRIRADLDGTGIAHDFVEVAAPTRICSTIIDRGAGTATELVEESAQDALLRKFSTLVDRAGLVVLSGALASGVSPEFYAECVRFARGMHVVTIVDARDKPLRLACMQKPMVVKLNTAELSSTFKHFIATEQHMHEAMRVCVRMGASWVIVTSGGNDVAISNGQDFWHITPPKIKVISAVGSGDAFAAGLAAALVAGEQMPDACVLATACASANAMTPVAGFLNRSDVEKLLLQITVTRS